jgi:hypothetical protein
MDVSVTDAGAVSFFTVIALVIPVFILAILVDSSRDAKRIGPIESSQSPDRVSIRQSRRTLLVVAVGGITEINTLVQLLTTPSDSENYLIAPLGYISIFATLGALLVLLYILFVPHIELHISNIRKDASTKHWTLVVGWISVAFLFAVAAMDFFLGGSKLNRALSYIYAALGLVLIGAMLILTFSKIGQIKPDTPPAESDQSSPAQPSNDQR